MNPDQLIDAIVSAGKVAGGATAIGITGRAFWINVYRPFKRTVTETTETLATVQRITPTLEKIAEQFRPNGGSTFRDALDRLEWQMQHLGEVQRAVIQNARCGIFEANGGGACTWVNQTLCRLTGRSAEELLGSGWVNSILHEEREEVAQCWSDAVMYRRDFEHTFRMVHSDGQEFRIIGRARMLRDKNGEPSGWIAMLDKVAAT